MPFEEFFTTEDAGTRFLNRAAFYNLVAYFCQRNLPDGIQLAGFNPGEPNVCFSAETLQKKKDWDEQKMSEFLQILNDYVNENLSTEYDRIRRFIIDNSEILTGIFNAFVDYVEEECDDEDLAFDEEGNPSGPLN